MKKLTCILGFLALSLCSFASHVDEKIVLAFNKAYPGAETIKWEDYKDIYIVYFVKNAVSHRVTYDTDGNIKLAIRYYAAENLPPIIYNKIKKAYPDFKATGVTETSTDEDISYHIVLDGAKKIMNLKSDSLGTLEVESKYNKQD